MICDPCKDGNHCQTAGCTCQHKPKAQILTPAGIDSGESIGDLGGSGDSQNSHVSYGSAIHGR